MSSNVLAGLAGFVAGTATGYILLPMAIGQFGGVGGGKNFAVMLINTGTSPGLVAPSYTYPNGSLSKQRCLRHQTTLTSTLPPLLVITRLALTNRLKPVKPLLGAFHRQVTLLHSITAQYQDPRVFMFMPSYSSVMVRQHRPTLC